MIDINLLWERIIFQLEKTYDEDTFNNNFNNIKLHKTHNNNVYFIVDSEFAKNKINKYYLDSINTISNSLSKEKFNYIFLTKEDIKKEEKKNSHLDTDIYLNTNLQANFTFTSFVVGQSNKFAFQTALNVADQPAFISNPFYIFGDVGLGKTHLMQAIGNYTIEKDITKKVVYVKADMFIEEYNHCINHIDRNQKMIEFNQKYRNLDLLLVDDIQMLSGATQTQKEFFKLFDYLFTKNKQIVITSDKPANKLVRIMDRLISRFSSGNSVDIKIPDLSHRIHILNKKLEQLFDPSIVARVDKNALQYIANIFTTNVRELEGALKRAITYCLSSDLDLIESNFAKALQALVDTKNVSDSLNENNYDKLLSLVSKYYHITVSDLISSKRAYGYSLPRQITMYLLKSIYNLSYKKIGELLGKRDHSTILNGCRKIEEQIKINNDIKTVVERLTTSISNK